MADNDEKLDPKWWSHAPSQMRILVTSLIAFTVTLTTGMAAWPHIEPYVYSSRGYVREHVSGETAKLRREFSPTTIGVYDIQIGIARSRRSAVLDQIFRAELEVPKSETTEEVVKRRAQIEKLKDEKDELDADIKRLLAAREKS